MPNPRPRIALTIAGSDPSGGAGIQGDLRTFAAFGLHGLSAITCITAQGTRGVRAVVPLDAKLVRAQIDVVLADVEADVVKTGALATAEIVREVVEALDAYPALPLVVDPVIASSSGARLLDDAGVRLLVERLMPRAAVITPNLDELAILTGAPRARDLESMERQARVLLARGARAVVAKGGHLEGPPIDLLVDSDGARAFEGVRIDSKCTHGTGCTFASAIAASLARGRSLGEAVGIAKEFVRAGIEAGVEVGEGTSSLGVGSARRPIG